MQKIKESILNSPGIKTIIFVLLVMLSGILCSAFVFEISTESGLIWNQFYTKKTFWMIVIYTVVVYFYNKLLYFHEKNVLKFLDDDYCLAYIRKECLPEIVNKYKEDIKSGKQPKEFIDIKKELRKLGKQ